MNRLVAALQTRRCNDNDTETQKAQPCDSTQRMGQLATLGQICLAPRRNDTNAKTEQLAQLPSFGPDAGPNSFGAAA